MRLTLSEFPDDEADFEQAFAGLADHVAQEKPDLVLLPEMPFTPWVFTGSRFDETVWRKVCARHDAWLARWRREILSPLLSSRPVKRGGSRQNEAFFLTASGSYNPLRSKRFLPDEPSARERVWFQEGQGAATAFGLDSLTVGLQLCSEMLYLDLPRRFAAEGVDLIVQPRATGGHPRWKTAVLAAAFTSGAFVASCNRRSRSGEFAGGCWLVAPDGSVLAETTETVPQVTAEFDAAEAARAREGYPMDMFRHYSAE